MIKNTSRDSFQITEKSRINLDSWQTAERKTALYRDPGSSWYNGSIQVGLLRKKA